MRRTLKTHHVASLFKDMGLEQVEPGWVRSNRGLASSNQVLDQLLEEMKVIPPRIYTGAPPPVIPSKQKGRKK